MTIVELREILISKLSLSRHQLSRYCRTKTVVKFIVENTQYLPNDCKMNVRCWHIINEIYKVPLCKHCQLANPKFNNNKWGYLDYCSIKCQCVAKQVIENRNNTIEKKYGNGITNAYQATEVKNKISNSMLEKYGVDHNFKSPEIRKNIISTNLRKYGVEHYSQTKEFTENLREHSREIFGVEHYSQTDEFKESFKRTCIKHYGVDHPMKDPTVCEKVLRKLHKFKEYKLPSGKIIKLQGYEGKALDLLFNDGLIETDLITSKYEIQKEIGQLKYSFKGKGHAYFPDFYIKSKKQVIEVKSTWTFDRCGKLPIEDNVFFKKKESVELAGFNFKLMIIK